MSARVPPELALVRAFVNTLDVETGEDELGTRAGVARWFRERGLLRAGGSVSDSDVAATTELRESLRSLLHAHHGAGVDEDAVEGINRLASGLPLHLSFDAEGRASVEPGVAGVRGALAHVLSGVVVAMMTGTWDRLKACSRESCQWAFYDRSRNRSARWCSMQVCGNRTKTRAYRARQRAEGV